MVNSNYFTFEKILLYNKIFCVIIIQYFMKQEGLYEQIY